MATQKVLDECNCIMKLSQRKELGIINLLELGIERVISDDEFMNFSECEQFLHNSEDNMLKFVCKENSNSISSVIQ